MEEDEEEGNGATQPGAITASALAEVDARVAASVPMLNHATEPWGRLAGVVFLGDVFQLPPFPSATEDSSGNARTEGLGIFCNSALEAPWFVLVFLVAFGHQLTQLRNIA